ncbi:uncharacterized protein LOC130814867 [Amaranthus tricolor]|uniref:uncharacterized protein LOC130814867 n=1 Tax=Amaranthus tricolor TaxID=29722 RepID=UPI002582D22A|nr:uncharacterized protein LOC130814867 [Amaranthus tricolor]
MFRQGDIARVYNPIKEFDVSAMLLRRARKSLLVWLLKLSPICRYFKNSCSILLDINHVLWAHNCDILPLNFPRLIDFTEYCRGKVPAQLGKMKESLNGFQNPDQI